METDTKPQQDNWLEQLDFYFDLDNFYVLGGSISLSLRQAWKTYGMPRYYINHLNGNAIYNLDKPVSRAAMKSFKNYIEDCFFCNRAGRNIFPYFLSSRMSFDIYLSYIYEFTNYLGYVTDDNFMINLAGTVTQEQENQTSLFVHQNSNYEFSQGDSFDILNLTGKSSTNVCEHTIPSRPFFIVHDNSFDKKKYVPTTKNMEYVLNAIPRSSNYCTTECLEETDFCKDEEECFYINIESVVLWPLDAYIECATRGIITSGSEYVTHFPKRYVLLDRSKVIVESPVESSFKHVQTLAASAGKPLSDAEIGAIVGGSVGGLLLCCGAAYLCRKRRS